ncbi:MAG: autotransporter-associated beta strand repeat-containing protein, partial [Planctomycetota bacterium]
GSGALVKVGSGTLVLSSTDASTYTGGTFVNEGTVYQKYSTSLPSNGSLTIGAGAKFIYDPSVTIAGPFIMAGPVSFLTSPAFASPVSMNSPLNPVPEPSTLALLVAGVVVGFGAWRKRRK